FRLLCLTDGGAQAVADWRVPSPVGAGAGRRRLARRLLDADMLAPRPPQDLSTSALTFVVPARDRPVQLERCLRAIREACADAPVIVVDDGSEEPVTVPE